MNRGQVPVICQDFENKHRYHYPQLWWSLTDTELIIETSYTVGPFRNVCDAPLETTVTLDHTGVISKICIPRKNLSKNFKPFPITCTYCPQGDVYGISFTKDLIVYIDYHFHLKSLNFSTGSEDEKTVIASMEILGSSHVLSTLMANHNVETAGRIYNF